MNTDYRMPDEREHPITQSGCSNQLPPSPVAYVCSECNWTNVSILNLGEFNKPRWVCHGCCKRAIETRDESLSKLREARPFIETIVLEYSDDMEARQLLDRIDTFLKKLPPLTVPLKGDPLDLP